MQTVIMIEFIVYFIIIVTIGLLTSRTNMSHSVFLLGGKKLPGWALAFSERATGASPRVYWIRVCNRISRHLGCHRYRIGNYFCMVGKILKLCKGRAA